VTELDLFGSHSQVPPGFSYDERFLSPAEERDLLDEFSGLPFEHFRFHGFEGRRRVVSFGWRYDFNGGGLQRADDPPPFLIDIRERVARFAGRSPGDFDQVSVIEYTKGAAIGWHKDRPVFGDVVGISLASACTLRFRRKVHERWARVSITAEPRSIYGLTGPARAEWEHSIPAVERLRYSITLRTLAKRT
jgi:alkylated DNA repair dioxygenase AlkB